MTTIYHQMEAIAERMRESAHFLENSLRNSAWSDAMSVCRTITVDVASVCEIVALSDRQQVVVAMEAMATAIETTLAKLRVQVPSPEKDGTNGQE